MKLNLFEVKYAPKKLNDVIQKTNIHNLKQWLINFENCIKTNDNDTVKSIKKKRKTTKFNVALVSGPSGIGKSLCASLLLKESGYKVLEFNASDIRSKKSMEEMVKTYCHN